MSEKIVCRNLRNDIKSLAACSSEIRVPTTVLSYLISVIIKVRTPIAKAA